ncbi:MAG TPA: methyl-accepting chemotaxis protein [Spirochaetota bacterium]|nr:methyl-accepting chemotaxis protein [Spirochaetota bacterium]HOM39022.1 methyl-accepting chemotaxis protein [Spirochaetota bacterium]HPQ49925.1 methyl-accepting chemotaxis protein [Spirochaetota bacterium]
MRVKTKVYLNNFSLFLILLISFIIIFTIVNNQLKKDIDEILHAKIDGIFTLVNDSLNVSIKNYLKGIVETNKKVIKEYHYKRYKNGELKEDDAKKRAAQLLLSQVIGDIGYIYVVNSSGIILIHPKESLVGNDVSKYDFGKLLMSLKEGYIEYKWKNPGEEVEMDKVLYMSYFPEWDWIISASAYKSEFIKLLDKEIIRHKIIDTKIGKTDYFFVLDDKGNVVFHPDLSLEGKNLKHIADADGNYPFKKIIESKEGKFSYRWKDPEGSIREKYMHFRTIDSLGWRVCSSYYVDEVEGQMKSTLYTMIIILIFTFIIVLATTSFSIKSILNPLKEMGDIISNISKGEGDLTSRVLRNNNDEFKNIGDSLNTFMDNLQKMVKELKDQAKFLLNVSEELAANSHQTASSVQEITATGQSVADNTQKQKRLISDAVSRVKKIIESIEYLHKSSETINDAISSASAAIEEMASNIVSAADMARNGDKASEKLMNASIEGSNAMTTLVNAIKDVASSSSQIEEMVKLIMDIAEQTNLLAMNAAIEAAHAGEYGKGFAVVAEEIRKLADKSAKGAKDIQNIVKVISENLNKNISLADKTNESFNLLKNNINDVKRISKEIDSAMEEQKNANKSILESIMKIKDLSYKMMENMKEEVKRSNDVEKGLENVLIMSEEIATSMEEQKNGLIEASSAAEHISSISNQIKNIAKKMEEDFNKFKTE